MFPKTECCVTLTSSVGVLENEKVDKVSVKNIDTNLILIFPGSLWNRRTKQDIFSLVLVVALLILVLSMGVALVWCNSSSSVQTSLTAESCACPEQNKSAD